MIRRNGSQQTINKSQTENIRGFLLGTFGITMDANAKKLDKSKSVAFEEKQNGFMNESITKESTEIVRLRHNLKQNTETIDHMSMLMKVKDIEITQRSEEISLLEKKTGDLKNHLLDVQKEKEKFQKAYGELENKCLKFIEESSALKKRNDDLVIKLKETDEKRKSSVLNLKTSLQQFLDDAKVTDLYSVTSSEFDTKLLTILDDHLIYKFAYLYYK